MDVGSLLPLLLRFLLILPAIILHEYAHGWVADRLGDPTPRAAGRLTLDPIAHIDLWGTILLPALLLFATGGKAAIGYAKPVPVNPFLMHRTTVRRGMLLTGIAGPLANVALGVVGGLLYRVLAFVPGMPSVVMDIAWSFVYLNLVLFSFNLIPIPPLDGSRVVQWILKGRALEIYDSITPFGFIIVFALLYLGWLTPFIGITAGLGTWLLTGVS